MQKLRTLHQPELAEFALKHYQFSAVDLNIRAKHNFIWHLPTTWLSSYFLKNLHFLRKTVIQKEFSTQLCPLKNWSQYNTESNQLFITWNTAPRY